MSQPDPCSIVRIAIALAVLKHKPVDQSIASYLLDLQSHFLVATNTSDSREWRTYALELEKQLAALKAQRDADQELLSKLPTDASQAASTSDAPPPKKKSKKNPPKNPEWSWDQSRADWSRILSSQYPSSPSLTAAYAALKGALDSPNADMVAYASRLADAISRALDAVHVFLFSAPNSAPDPHTQPTRLKPEHMDSTRIALASPLLMYVLRSALPTLIRAAQDSTKSKRPRVRAHVATAASADAHAHVDKVLDCLLERVLLALVRALAPLCSAHLAPLLSVPPRKDERTGRAVGKGKDKDKRASSAPEPVDPPKTTDVRTDVFALIGTSLEALDALPSLIRPGVGGGSISIASGIRDRLGLETIRELEALYAPPSPPPPPSSCPVPSQQPPLTPTDLPPPTPTPTSPPSAPSHPSQPPRPQRPESHAQRLERLARTRADRVCALATRDAGWFLASTLSLCVTPGGPGDARDAAGKAQDAPALGGLLREALLDRVGKLVRSVPVAFGGRVSDAPSCSPTPKFPIDPVCQNMLLAICERALSQLAPP